MFDTQKVEAAVSIKPAGDVENEMIKVTISAPVDSIQEAIKLMDKGIGGGFAKLKDLFEKPSVGQKQKKTKKKFKGWKKVSLKEL